MKDLSKRTIEFYYITIHNFELCFDLDNKIEDIDEITIEEYVRYLQCKEIKSVTISTYVRDLRTILYFFMKLGYLNQFKIPLPKIEKEIKETYTDEELKLLLKKPNSNYLKSLICNNIRKVIGLNNRLFRKLTDCIRRKSYESSYMY